jgi:type IV fimbrial biogenesis protein FimT
MIPFQLQRGFTLLELIITIAVLAIVTASVSASWSSFVERNSSYVIQSGLSRTFALARSSAVKLNEVTTICPLDGTMQCSRDWDRSITIFVDPLNERALTPNTEVLRVFDLPEAGSITASKSGPYERRYFQYNPNGTTRGTLGNLVWCPISQEASRAIQLRMNFGGRITWARDSNKDGVKEDAQGQPLRCP